jgi:TolB-like protein
MTSFWGELKRRNVVRVAIAYAIVSWLLLQMADVVLDNIEAPTWVFQVILLLLVIGFPVAIIFAWAFELTPEGLKKEKDVDRTESITHRTGRKLDFVIIGVLAIAVVYFIWERQYLDEVPDLAADAVADLDTPGAEAEITVATEAEPIRRSIAVLPFVNMSSDQDQEWFADGLTEEILNALARTPDLLVSARTSSFAYKDSGEDIPTIAAALGVQHILEGSVRRSSDRLRVTAQLVRASDGFHLWSQIYDRQVADVIDIQENVAIEIARALKTAIDPEALARFVSSGTDSIPAYEAYLRGLSAGASSLVSGDVYEYLDARDAYDEAVRLDPEFALAYWRLAEFWQVQLAEALMPSGLTDLSPDEIRGLFDAAITNAIEFEKDSARNVFYRSVQARVDLNLRRSLRLITEYLTQRPNDIDAHMSHVILLSELGRYDELFPVVNAFYDHQGYDAEYTATVQFNLLFSGDNDELSNFTKNALQRIGDNANILYQAQRASLWLGDIDAASKLLPLVEDGDLPESIRLLASLRQACAENRLTDAKFLFDRGIEKYAHETATVWIMQKIMGYDELASNYLMAFDERNELSTMASFLTYGMFDPHQYPNLMAKLGDQMDDRGETRILPYRCKID